MRLRTLELAWMSGLLLALFAGRAEAYHPVPGFHLEAYQGGASGIYYTGSPRWDGLTCGTCHVDAPKQIRFHVSATPEDIFTSGRYQPGATYRVTIGVSGAEGKGLRTWMMETLNDSNWPVGSYIDIPGGACTTNQGVKRSCLQPSCTFMCKKQLDYSEWCAPEGQPICQRVVEIPGCEQCDAGDSCGACNTVDGVVGGVVVPSPWMFDFVAPPVGTGPITLYFGGVAGTSDHTSLGDDYQMLQWRLCEGATDCTEAPVDSGEALGDYTPGSPAGGCSAADQGPMSWALFVLLALTAARIRKRAR